MLRTPPRAAPIVAVPTLGSDTAPIRQRQGLTLSPTRAAVHRAIGGKGSDMRFRAVIFDMDGTLLDSERLVVDAGMATLARMGLPPRREALLAMVGMVGNHADDTLRAAFGPRFDIALFEQTWREVAADAFDRPIPLRPGARTLLDHLDRLALPRALATNSHTTSARKHLTLAGIGGYFDLAHIHGRDRVARPKPAPDLFLHAARVLGIAATDCLVFEDSDPGTAAALAAGMTVVQVPDQRPAASDAAHVIAASLLDGARAVGLLSEGER